MKKNVIVFYGYGPRCLLTEGQIREAVQKIEKLLCEAGLTCTTSINEDSPEIHVEGEIPKELRKIVRDVGEVFTILDKEIIPTPTEAIA